MKKSILNLGAQELTKSELLKTFGKGKTNFCNCPTNGFAFPCDLLDRYCEADY